MSKYVVITEVKSEAHDVEWWMDQTNSKITVEIKDEFRAARELMRNTICKLTAECDFFPADEGHFEAFDEYDYGEVEELDEIVTEILTDPTYFCDSAEDFDVQDTDDGDWYFAFVGNPGLILVDYYGKKLKFNVHNMDDSGKDYFFEYTEIDDDGRTINEISVRLLNTERKNDGVIYISRRLGSGGDYKDTPRKRIFIDMDGVLCEYRPEASVDDMMQNGYFASLKPRKEMLDAVKGLIKFGKYDVYVLSAVIAECAEQSKFEKNEWLDRYIPEIGSSHRIFTLCGTNKADAVESITLTDILLDDHSPNLEAWINAGGKAIKVLNECNGMNGTFVTGPRIKIDSTTTLLRALTNI